MTLLKGVTVSFVRTAACNPGSAGAGTSAPLCWLPLLSHTFTCSALSHDLPKSPRAAGRARLPQPRERVSGFAFAIKRDHLLGPPPPPSPRRRGAEDRLGGGGEEMSLPRSAGR